MRKLAWLFAALALCAQAQVYKWTDEKGQVHYGEQPPPDANTTTLKVPSQGPAPAVTPPPSDKPEDVAVKSNVPADKAERCKSEKEQLQILQSADPVGYLNEKKEPVVYDAAQRAAKVEQTQALIKKYCS